MSTPIVVTTHRIAFGELLARHLRTIRGFQPVLVAEGVRDALKQACAREKGVALIDPGHPTEDVFGPASVALRSRHRCYVIFFSDCITEGWVSRSLEVGAAGFLGPGAALPDFERAIRSAREGQRFFGPGVGRVVSELAARGPRVPSFSERELDVLRLVCEGYSTKEVARKLGLQAKTIDEIRLRLMQKTGTERATALVRYACEERFADLRPRWERFFEQERSGKGNRQ